MSEEPGKQTTQQRFDAGRDALLQLDWQKAYEIYGSLESDLVAKHPEAKSLAIIRLRKGLALDGLKRFDEAEPVLSAALEALPPGSDLADDRYLALQSLAGIAARHIDYPLAVARYHQAYEVAQQDSSKLGALIKAAPMAIFVDPVAGLRDLDTAQSLVASMKLKDQQWEGLIRDYRGRSFMNMGDLKGARKELDRSIKLLGGLRYGKANILDAAARSDAAIAALLDKQPERARELLTFAGASMAADQGFSRARDSTPPSCDIPGLAQTDVAVVEFSILDDGSVTEVRPIYFSGQRSLAFEFSRAVARWSWSQEQLKSLDPFFRALARVELRCSNRFKQPRVSDLLRPAAERWLMQKNVPGSSVSLDVPDAVQLAPLRSELQQRRAPDGSMSLSALPVLMALAANSALPFKEKSSFAAQAYDLAVSNGADSEAKTWFLLLRLRFADGQTDGSVKGQFQRELARALEDPNLAGDPRAEAALRIMLFDSLNAKSRKTDGKSILEPLLAASRLVRADPLSVGARIRMADLEYVSGDLQSARAHFEQSGLSAQQCALVDAKPAQTRSSFGFYAFPDEALRWHLGGWTVTEFDISPQGVPLNPRTVAAFPPFVFGANSEKEIQASRYEQSYRPGGDPGCVANNVAAKYTLRQ